jgi:outer membrane protein assembly factor BamB
MKRIKVIMLGIGGTLVSVSLMITFFYFIINPQQAPSEQLPIAGNIETSFDTFPPAEFIVAIEPITQGARIEAGSVVRRSYDARIFDPGPSLVFIEAEAVNKIAASDIISGLVMYRSMFLDPNEEYLDTNCFSLTATTIACYNRSGEQQYIYRFDKKLNKEVWRIELEPIAILTLAASQSMVYFWREDNQLYALNENGDEVWKYNNPEITKVTGYTTPKIINDSLIIWNEDNQTLYTLKANTGQEKWQFKLEGAIVFGPGTVTDKVISVTDVKYMYQLDLKTGHVIHQEER